MRPKTLFVPVLVALLAVATASAQRTSPLIYDDPEFEWLDNRDPDSPRPSPNALVGLQIGSTRVMVAYGSPGVKERKIFGGLVPFGRLWRTGANEATTLTTNGHLLVEGERLPAGTYALFTVPGEREWKVVFNSESNQWGAYSHDPEKDVLDLTVAAREHPHVENLTFAFDGIHPSGAVADLVIAWETTAVRMTIEEAE